MGATFAATSAVSLMNLSSPQGLWIMVKQTQLLMLLSLTGAYIPKDITDSLEGMSFVNFNFFSLSSIPVISWLYEHVDFEQANASLNAISLEHGSTLLNILPILLTVLGFGALHCVF